MSLSPRPARPQHAAFSLVELLAVMAVMALMMSLLAPAFNNLGKSSELSTKGFEVAELIQFARQNAMARNALTALVIAEDASLKDKGKLFTLFELAPGTASSPSSWKQASRWNNIGGSIVATDLVDGSPALPVPLPPITYSGQTVNSYKTVLFLPDGSLFNSEASLRLVAGYYSPDQNEPILTGTKSDQGSSADYCAITVLPATGKVIIDRP